MYITDEEEMAIVVEEYYKEEKKRMSKAEAQNEGYKEAIDAMIRVHQRELDLTPLSSRKTWLEERIVFLKKIRRKYCGGTL